jgi:hypothetical protein
VTFFTSGLCSGRGRTHRAAVSNYRPALRLSTSVNLAAAIRFRAIFSLSTTDQRLPEFPSLHFERV